jgi:hypothetical protein
MPLARIFTHHPERTAALSSQLQEQGYTVEVASPDQAHLAPADLEIEFEICERADVLERAAGLADELHADVAVASGVMQPSAQAEQVPVHVSAPVPETVESPVSPQRDPEREFEAAFAASQETPVDEKHSPVVEIPVMQRGPLPPVAFADEPRPPEVGRPADPVPYLAQLTPFGTPSVDAEIQGAALRLENSPGREPSRQSPADVETGAPARHSFWERMANVTARAVTSTRAIAASTAASFREQAQEYKKKAQVRSAEARAAHEARLLDLEQRRAEAQQRAEELEAAREAAAARLVELVRERDPGLKEEILHEQSAREEILHEQTTAGGLGASPSPQPSRVQTVWQAAIALLKKPRQPMTPQLRAVLTGAAAVSVLFLIGIILGSLYPRTPLARPASQSSGGVTVQSSGPPAQSGGVTVKASGPPTQAAPAKPPQPAASANASAPAPQQEKPSPRVSQTQRIAEQQGEDTIGDDVVIRHFKRLVPTQKPKQSGQQAGLKHFSDLDN